MGKGGGEEWWDGGKMQVGYQSWTDVDEYTWSEDDGDVNMPLYRGDISMCFGGGSV